MTLNPVGVPVDRIRATTIITARPAIPLGRLAAVLFPGSCTDSKLLDLRRVSQAVDIHPLQLQGRTKANGKTRDADRVVDGVPGEEWSARQKANLDYH